MIELRPNNPLLKQLTCALLEVHMEVTLIFPAVSDPCGQRTPGQRFTSRVRSASVNEMFTQLRSEY